MTYDSWKTATQPEYEEPAMRDFDFSDEDTAVFDLPLREPAPVVLADVPASDALPEDETDPPEMWLRESTLPYRQSRSRVVLRLP